MAKAHWQRFSQSLRVSCWFAGMPIGPICGGSLPVSHWAAQSDMNWRRSGEMVVAQALVSASIASSVQ
jgi:hypothetical protein